MHAILIVGSHSAALLVVGAYKAKILLCSAINIFLSLNFFLSIHCGLIKLLFA